MTYWWRIPGDIRPSIKVICYHRAFWLTWFVPESSHRTFTLIIRVSGMNKGLVTMYVEYMVLQANAEQGPFARVSAQKLNQSWNTLQEALDELGQQEWDLCTTIYSATREQGGPGEHYCEGFILKRMSSTAGDTNGRDGTRRAHRRRHAVGPYHRHGGRHMDTVGFIGLGNMGSGRAGNIQKAGYPLVVYDTRPEAMRPFLEREARPGKSPAEVAQLSEVIFTSLPGPKEVEAVAIGAQRVLEGIKAGGIYVDLSTSRPTLIRQIEPLFRQKRASVLDAPVSGGKTGAATRNMAVMVGGERAIYERIKPILEAFGDKVFYAGSIGAGSVCTRVHNMIGHGIRHAIAEGLTLGVKAGVEADALWECVRRGAVGRMSGLHEGLPRTVCRGPFEPASFTLALSRNDIALATELGREYNVPMPSANLAEQIAIEAMNRCWAEKDSSITFLLQEEAAGVQVRAPDIDPEKAATFITTHPGVDRDR